MNLPDMVLPAFTQMLDALSGQLGKAREQLRNESKPVDGLLSARLAPDMFPLSSQVQFACLQAEEARARLLGDAIETVEPVETVSEAEALISRTVKRLRASGTQGVRVDETRMIELKLQTGMIFDLDLPEYVRSWSIPQFYFHLITAYAIMRKEGIDLGKADYVPHMLRFVRDGTA